jgi:phage tail-like protein
MPSVGQLLEVNLAYRFTVVIDSISYAAFTECTLPSLQVETFEIKEGGQNTFVHKLPVRVNAGTVSFKHGITRTGELLRWYMQVLNGDMASATRDVSVVVYDEMRAPLFVFSFRRAYPIKWSGPSLRAGDSAVAIEELELAHHGFEVG